MEKKMTPVEIRKRAIIGFFALLYLVFLVLKVFITLTNSGFVDYNARNAARIENILSLKKNYSFIVAGNVRNSLGVFEKELLPLINSSDADFVVFPGNTVLDGADDKYAAFYRTLLKLKKPALITLGDTEVSDGGIKNFFRHIGSPLFFFISGQSEFVFLDTTGYMAEEYQLAWIKDLLNNIRNVSTRFVFMNRSPVLKNGQHTGQENKYRMSASFKNSLLAIFSKAEVSAVISSGSGYDMLTRDGVKYIASGGGGGSLGFHADRAFFHCTEVRVTDGTIAVSLLKPDLGKIPQSLTFVEYVWNRVYSWVYVYYVNVILIISFLFLAVYFAYTRLVERVDYYPDFMEPTKKDYPLKIVMFTNNYLPFIGGVPLSISRLKQGLEERGHKVYIFAPQYGGPKTVTEETDIIRCTPLFYYRKGGLIVPVSNIFSSRIKREFKAINPDIVHVHHPFWLGSTGRHLAEKYNKPVVFTYHTRLEQYNHNVPFFHQLAGGQIPHMLIKYFASGCDAVVAPTKTAKRYLRNIGVGKLILVQPTGVDMKLFSPSVLREAVQEKPLVPEGRLMLLSVFRLSKEKNPFFLLEGLRILARSSSVPFVCYIAGTGPEENAMKTYIQKYDMQDYVVMLGSVSPEEIPRYYALADLFVFTSQSETQGMVILEAMAGGTPVVAVNSSGISDTIEDGVNGFKTEPDLGKWTRTVKRVLENEAERATLSKHASIAAQENSIERMSENILSMYYEIIDWKKKHPHQNFIR